MSYQNRYVPPVPQSRSVNLQSNQNSPQLLQEILQHKLVQIDDEINNISHIQNKTTEFLNLIRRTHPDAHLNGLYSNLTKDLQSLLNSFLDSSNLLARSKETTEKYIIALRNTNMLTMQNINQKINQWLIDLDNILRTNSF
jgi:DNA gyrase/topoisomerase IV subunit B